MRSSLYRGLYKQAYEVLKASLMLFSSQTTKEATLAKVSELRGIWSAIERDGKFLENEDASSTLLLWVASFKLSMARFPSPKEVGDNVILMSLNKTSEYYDEQPVFHQLREINRASLLCSLITGGEFTDKDFGIICSCDCLTRDGVSLASPKDRFNFSFCSSLRRLKHDKDVPNMSQDDLFARFQKDLYHAGNRLPGRTSATLYASTLDTIMGITDDEYFKGISNLELIQLLFNQLYVSKDNGFLSRVVEAVLDFNLKRASSAQPQAAENDLKRRKTIAAEEGNTTVDMSNYGIETMEKSANKPEVIELDSDSGGSQAADSAESVPQKVLKTESPPSATTATAVAPYNPPPPNGVPPRQEQPQQIVFHQQTGSRHPNNTRPAAIERKQGVQSPHFQPHFYVPVTQQQMTTQHASQFHGGRPITPQSPIPQYQQIVQAKAQQQNPPTSPTLGGPVSQSTPQGSPSLAGQRIRPQPAIAHVQPKSAPPQQQQQQQQQQLAPEAVQPASPSLPQNPPSSAPPQPAQEPSSPSLAPNNTQNPSEHAPPPQQSQVAQKPQQQQPQPQQPAQPQQPPPPQPQQPPQPQPPPPPQQQPQQQPQPQPQPRPQQKKLLPAQADVAKQPPATQSPQSRPAQPVTNASPSHPQTSSKPATPSATSSSAQPRPPQQSTAASTAPTRLRSLSSKPASSQQPRHVAAKPSSSGYTPASVSTKPISTNSRQESLPSAPTTRPIQHATTSNQSQASSYVPSQKPQNFRYSSTGAQDTTTSSKPEEGRHSSDPLPTSKPPSSSSDKAPSQIKKTAGVSDFYGTQSKPHSSPSSTASFTPANKPNDESKALEQAASLGANRSSSSSSTNYVQNLQRVSSTANRTPAKKLESNKTYF
jgi:hypothetical protein